VADDVVRTSDEAHADVNVDGTGRALAIKRPALKERRTKRWPEQRKEHESWTSYLDRLGLIVRCGREARDARSGSWRCIMTPCSHRRRVGGCWVGRGLGFYRPGEPPASSWRSSSDDRVFVYRMIARTHGLVPSSPCRATTKMQRTAAGYCVATVRRRRDERRPPRWGSAPLGHAITRGRYPGRRGRLGGLSVRQLGRARRRRARQRRPDGPGRSTFLLLPGLALPRALVPHVPHRHPPSGTGDYGDADGESETRPAGGDRGRSIRQVLDEVVGGAGGGLLSLGVVGALWTASAGGGIADGGAERLL